MTDITLTDTQGAAVKKAAAWRVIPGWPEYEVSDDGQVRRAIPGSTWPAGRHLKPAASDTGHLYVMLSRNNKSKKMFVHQAVALAFIGPRPTPKHCALHKDDIPDRNVVDNIYWGTRLDNFKDRMLNKGWNRNQPRGSGVGSSILKEHDIPIIRERKLSGEKVSSIALEYGVSVLCIYDVLSGKTWRHV